MGSPGNRFPTLTLLCRHASQAVVTYFRCVSFFAGAIFEGPHSHSRPSHNYENPGKCLIVQVGGAERFRELQKVNPNETHDIITY